MADESRVFKALKAKVAKATDRFERVENGLGAGWPDVNYCMSGREGWIEIKDGKEPARPETPYFGSNHKVSVEQCNFFLSQHMAIGQAWLFIATDKRLLLIHGGRVAQAGVSKINRMTIEDLLSISAWSASVPVKDFAKWIDLRELLTSANR